MDRREELVAKLFTNGKYDARRVKGGVPLWLRECEGESVAEKVWLHFHNRHRCYCGNTTEFLTYPTGYREYCSRECYHDSKKTSEERRARLERRWANDRESLSTAMKQAHHNNRAQAKLNNLAAKGIVPLEEIKPGMQNEYRWRHSCGEEFTRPFTRVTGIWCPRCHVSRGQGELYEAIRARYSGPIIVNDRKTLKPKEIDIYLPELKLGFEYHGEYWHPGDGTREASKIMMAAERGIMIEEFWELLWKHKMKQQLARLDALIGNTL